MSLLPNVLCGRGRDGVPERSAEVIATSRPDSGQDARPRHPIRPRIGRRRDGACGARASRGPTTGPAWAPWPGAPPGAVRPARSRDRRARPPARASRRTRVRDVATGREGKDRPEPDRRVAVAGERNERCPRDREPLPGGGGQGTGQEQAEPVGPARGLHHDLGIPPRVGRDRVRSQRLGQQVARQVGERLAEAHVPVLARIQPPVAAQGLGRPDALGLGRWLSWST